jgi:hypothetical protein
MASDEYGPMGDIRSMQSLIQCVAEPPLREYTYNLRLSGLIVSSFVSLTCAQAIINMSQLLILPTPLATSSFSLGQLLVDPLTTGSASFGSPFEPECKGPVTEAQYQDIISHDEEGRFIASVPRKASSVRENSLHLSAEQMSHISLASPSVAFDALRRDTATQSFLRRIALQKQPLYYVTGIQRLTNPAFKQVTEKKRSTNEASNRQFRLPSHIRRDSGDMAKRNDSNEVIFAVELRKVRCRVGASDEPHSLEDIEFSWSYHSLDEADTQLSIGLGKKLEAKELRALAGIVSDEDFADEGYDTYEEEDESEGFAGF